MMRFLTARDAELLTNLGRHYHSTAVAATLKTVLDQVRTAALSGVRRTTVENSAAGLDFADLIDALGTLGYLARTISNTSTGHVIEITW